MRFLGTTTMLSLLLANAACDRSNNNAIEQRITFMEQANKATCACKDLACAQKIEEQLSEQLEKLADTAAKPSDAQAVRLETIAAQAYGCMTALNPKADAPQHSAEAQMALKMIGKGAKTAFAADGGFPVADIPLTPAESPCKQEGKQFAADPSLWTGAWAALDFAVTDSSRFQYSYKGTKDTFVASAVGDLRCDGKTVTHTLSGSVVDGAPVLETKIGKYAGQ